MDFKEYIHSMNNADRCPICGGKLGGDKYVRGCNAQPLFQGRCCHTCDYKHVIPARIALLDNEQSEFEMIQWFTHCLAILTKGYLEFNERRYINE